MAKARVEVYKLPLGMYDNSTAAHVVYALRQANRVVEVDWRDGHMVFIATYPIPRAVRVRLPTSEVTP